MKNYIVIVITTTILIVTLLFSGWRIYETSEWLTDLKLYIRTNFEITEKNILDNEKTIKEAQRLGFEGQRLGIENQKLIIENQKIFKEITDKLLKNQEEILKRLNNK